MASTLRTGAPPRWIVIALDALQGIAELATLACRACREIKAEVAGSGGRFDERRERDHCRNCAGQLAWPCISRIVRGGPTSELLPAVTAVLQEIAVLAALGCPVCLEIKAEHGDGEARTVLPGGPHRRNCAGELAWTAINQIATKPPPVSSSLAG
jgi:hypothetical protein